MVIIVNQPTSFPYPHPKLDILTPQTAVLAFRETISANKASFQIGPASDEAARSKWRFSTRTLLADVIRVYTAYGPESHELCIFAMWTFAIAAVHFALEGALAGFKTSVTWAIGMWNESGLTGGTMDSTQFSIVWESLRDTNCCESVK